MSNYGRGRHVIVQERSTGHVQYGKVVKKVGGYIGRGLVYVTYPSDPFYDRSYTTYLIQFDNGIRETVSTNRYLVEPKRRQK